MASNVPGHEQVTCIVTDGDTNKLVSTMMTILQSMSEAAYDKIKDSYDHVLEQLAEELTKWDAREGSCTGGSCTRDHREESSTGNQSVQNADGTTVWMDAAVTCHRVQFGEV